VPPQSAREAPGAPTRVPRLGRAAVVAGLRECPFDRLPNEPGFAPLVVHWLIDSDSWEWFPPPLTEAQVAAIYQRLVASAN
jgi:hypothetical protein